MRTSTAHFKVSGVAAPTISRTLAQLNHLITLCAPTLSCIDRLFVDYVAVYFRLALLVVWRSAQQRRQQIDGSTNLRASSCAVWARAKCFDEVWALFRVPDQIEYKGLGHFSKTTSTVPAFCPPATFETTF